MFQNKDARNGSTFKAQVIQNEMLGTDKLDSIAYR